MSGWTPDVQLRAMDAVFLHFRTPHTQLGPVFQCFPFCYNSNISLIYCGCLTLRTMAAAFLHYWTTGTQLSQVSQCFAKSEPLTSNSVQTSTHLDIHSDTHAYPPLSNYLPSSIYFPLSCRLHSLPLPSVLTHLTPLQMSVTCPRYEYHADPNCS